jgi:hypothetical protein
MTIPVRLTSCFARALVPLMFLVPVLHTATLCRAEPPPAPEVQTIGGDTDTSDLKLFSADPLSTSPAGGPRLTPGGFAALHEFAASDWAQRIDQTWGPSPWTIPEMLGLFDTFWNKIDLGFACFQGLDVDWVGLREPARAEIEAGVSRGRFAAIMNHLALALRESHTGVWDLGVNYSALDPGVPLFVVGGWGNNARFGAGLTPLPDGSLLVYKAMPSHPLGLVPGDIVLGYEGVPWKQLYRELLAAQLPLTGWWWGSSESSWTHSMLMSAGLNWHLFDTIDVVKHATGETVHLSVAPLVSAPQSRLDCTEQLPIPDFLGSGDTVSWGLVEGTDVGYVYVRQWSGDAGNQLLDAVRSLLTQYQTSGLIFDFRTNYGGNMFLSYPALSMLFGRGDTSTIGFASRCYLGSHDMCPSAYGLPRYYVIHGSAEADYDRPIAVLMGPGAVSSGDQVAHLFSFHPRARFFGKSTSTAFNAGSFLPLGIAGWSSVYAAFDAYRVTDPTNYLTHDEIRVDEAVWLTPDDVARGKDTVVEAALRWILNRAPVCDGAQATINGPPDHQLAMVTIEGVSDPDGDPVTLVATAITQDEPVNGSGDGLTCPDATILDGVAQVRRERAGRGNGRVYFVSFTASDDHGGECRRTVPVCVPHDRGGNRSRCLDDGQRYDSLATCEQTSLVE